MSMVKTKREIGFLKKACEISNSCIPIIAKALKENGMTEREIGKRVRENIYRHGGRLSFRTLVASGDRSAMIHCKPTVTDRVISGIGYVDFGASYMGYKSDVTVPFIKGGVGTRERKIVRTVLKAYEFGVRKFKVGMPCWKMFETVNGYVASQGLKMEHLPGHGIGKKIHERPIMVMPRKKLTGRKLKKWERIKKVTFEPNIVFTIEPGAYVKGVGGSRIENTFMTTGKTLKCLTRARLIEV